MKCRYCGFELVTNYKYYNHSMTCKLCGTDFLFGPDEFSSNNRRDINDVLYNVMYFSRMDKTYVYKSEDLICILEGEIDPDNVFKRLKTIKVFS